MQVPSISLRHVHHEANSRLLIAPGIFCPNTWNLLRLSGTSGSILGNFPEFSWWNTFLSLLIRDQSHAKTFVALTSISPMAFPHAAEPFSFTTNQSTESKTVPAIRAQDFSSYAREVWRSSGQGVGGGAQKRVLNERGGWARTRGGALTLLFVAQLRCVGHDLLLEALVHGVVHLLVSREPLVQVPGGAGDERKDRLRDVRRAARHGCSGGTDGGSL